MREGAGGKRIRTVVLLVLAAIAVAVPLIVLSWRDDAPSELDEVEATFVGSAACRDCHPSEVERWIGSDHDKAMEVATAETVLGDFEDATFSDGRVTSRFYRRDDKFLVWTEGPGGEMGEFEITHVFGHDPLQQYLVPFPGGRLQALNVTWDAERGRWYRQYPDREIPVDDWLHWTRGGQNWNSMCAECHSTNLRKGYDADTDTYDTTWSDIDVGCEACHGPGSRHVAWGQNPPAGRQETPGAGLLVATSGISPRRLVGICAPCHSRRAELGDYDHTGAELLDHMLPSLLSEGQYHSDGQILGEVYVYGSFLQSEMYVRDVSCANCHDSHSLELSHEGNELCLQCHQPEVFDHRDHHFHKKIYQGRESGGAKCVKCHMVERPYMGIDWRADHSFRVPRPDLSLATGAPNACSQSGCHDDKPLEWSVDAYRRWYGEARKPHFGTTFAAARDGDPEARDELARLAGSEFVAPIVRSTALELLNPMAGEGGTAPLWRGIDSDEPLVRRTAAMILPLVDSADVQRLVSLLSDPVRAVRMAAVSRLAPVQRLITTPHQRDAFSAALAEYREAMAYTLDFASSAFNLGKLEAGLGNPAAAETYYRRALEIDDLFAPAKANLAVLLSGQGRNEEAESLLREILRDYPEDSGAMVSLGLLRVEIGDAEEGAAWLSRAADLRPNDARVRRNLGLLLQEMGRLEDAEAALRRAYELDSISIDVMHAWADHLLRRGRLEDAKHVADRMIEIYPDEPLSRHLERATHP